MKERTSNFFIGFYRFLYVFLGVCFIFFGLFAGGLAAGLQNPTSVLRGVLLFIFNFGCFSSFGIIFFWMAHMLKKRKALVVKLIIPIHLILSLPVLYLLLYRVIHTDPGYEIDTIISLSFWSAVSLLPIWIFTRPLVKEQFKN